MADGERASNPLVETATRLVALALLLYAAVRIIARFLDLIVWCITGPGTDMSEWIDAGATSPPHA